MTASGSNGWASLKRRIRRLLPSWLVLLRAFRRAHGRWPNLASPSTFNEMILHRNLFDRRPVLTLIADKAAVRDYVAKRVGAEILPRLHHLTTSPETIPFDALPDRFAVKPTHGSGWVRLVRDKAALDRAELIAACRDWLGRSYHRETRESVYRGIPPQILIEELIDDGSGGAPADYKLFVFAGVVEFIQVDIGRFWDHRRRLHAPDWKRLDVRFSHDGVEGDVPPPPHLAQMIEAAQALGRDWDFIRADFYDTPERLYFGELTLTPEGGHGQFSPPGFDRYLGDLWRAARAGTAIRRARTQAS